MKLIGRPAIILAALACLLAACSRNAAPVIGISSGWNGRSSSLGDTYVNAIFRAGGVPVILPLVRDEEQAKALLSRIDGLVLSGGEDIDPAYYKEEVLNGSVEVNAPRDTGDFLLIRAARDCGKPIMGICRGLQLVNVAFGGTLYQDLPSQMEVQHRQDTSSNVPTHMVGFEKGSRIHGLVGPDSLMTNTHHHQAIKDIAPGLRITARAADGVVEGCEGPGVFCVQFHPEALIKGGDDTFLPLFQAFVNDCRE